jgi:hypothetical protein
VVLPGLAVSLPWVLPRRRRAVVAVLPRLCRVFAFAVPLPWFCSVLQRVAFALSLPCICRVLAVLLPCLWRGFVSLPWFCRGFAMPCFCLGFAIVLLWF